MCVVPPRFILSFSANLLDCASFPRIDIFPHLHSEPVHLGSSLQHCHPIRHTSQLSRPMAPHSSPLGLRRQLARLRPRLTLGTPNQNHLNRAPSPLPALVPARCLRHPPNRPYPLRRPLHRTPLPLPQPLARQIRYYYVFGFLSSVSLILLVTIAEVTIIATYSQLCAENHHWWWQSFLTGGSSAFWIFAYCIWYYLFKLNVTGFVSGLLFFSYSFLACAVYGLLTGTVGFLTAYAFVKRIYR